MDKGYTHSGGYGTKEEAKVDTDRQAREYARRYENELNEKARQRNRYNYAPSHISVQIVGCSFWRWQQEVSISWAFRYDDLIN